ncbi:MAG: hypothetical protein UW86_C0015G0003 [Microgenomates group bacterium GW2011_GWA1_Microgenomates_45_10]|nr:MAG: hypothetical protein UW86_C0015G0003 [Microgenomates group bacterium GW2011_GWA1_Microgenomates_45_10]
MDLSIISLLSTYQLPAIFLGAFFFGETVILTAAFLAGQGTWSIESVFWLSLAGTVISDSLWFLLGQTFFKFTKRWEKYQDQYQTFLIKLEKITGQRPFLSLLFIKFLYGTRILTILYLSIREVRFFTFLLFNTVGTILWLLVMISVGWLVGRGATNITDVFYKVEYALTALVLLIVFFKIMTTWLSKKIVKQ